ncbi:UNVERIFIED_CONTAM: hypothetical protein GTU68_013923 [Idotea baltica]|nr:hypothetical protein [Idotea baltica]
MYCLVNNLNSNSWHNYGNNHNLVSPQNSSITANTPNPRWALNPGPRYTSSINTIPAHSSHNAHHLALPNAQLPGHSKNPHVQVHATSPELYTHIPTQPSLNPATPGFPIDPVQHRYGDSPYYHAPINGTSSQLQKTPLAFDPASRSDFYTPYPTQPGCAPVNGTSSLLQRPQLALDPALASSLITPCHAQSSLNLPSIGLPSHVPVCGTSPRPAHESRDAVRSPLAASSNEAESCESETRRCRCIKCVLLSKEGQKKEHKCHIPGCAKVYGKSSNLKVHIRAHSGERPYKCDWGWCGKAFPRSGALQRHYRTHTGERNYECEECGKRFKRSDHLSKHRKNHFKPRPDLKLNGSDHI